jgi:hypothetical protein
MNAHTRTIARTLSHFCRHARAGAQIQWEAKFDALALKDMRRCARLRCSPKAQVWRQASGLIITQFQATSRLTEREPPSLLLGPGVTAGITAKAFRLVAHLDRPLR